MLQDLVRTSIYHDVVEKFSDVSFSGKSVMDVGSGSGILSFFAAKAGAAVVYAVEASPMASKMAAFIKRSHQSGKNHFISSKIKIIAGVPGCLCVQKC